MSAVAGKLGGLPGSPEERVYESRALAGLLEHVTAPGAKIQVLDLGPTVPENVQYFGRFPSVLHLPGTLSELAVLPLEEEKSFYTEEQLRRLVPAYADTVFDAVLCWDLLNYVDEGALIWLGHELERHARSGTAVFAAMATHGQIPARPAEYRLSEESMVLRRTPAGAMKRATRYGQGDLIRLWPRFEVHRSFLLQNGMQEYLMLFT